MSDASKIAGIAAAIGSVLLKEAGEFAAKGLLSTIVEFLGESATKDYVDQFAAARVAADAAELAKFGK